MIGGDSLNALLEQKLRELTSKIESSSLIQEGSLKSISSSSLIQEESESVSDCTSFYNNQIFQVSVHKMKLHYSIIFQMVFSLPISEKILYIFP